MILRQGLKVSYDAGRLLYCIERLRAIHGWEPVSQNSSRATLELQDIVPNNRNPEEEEWNYVKAACKKMLSTYKVTSSVWPLEEAIAAASGRSERSSHPGERRVGGGARMKG